jgi:outer membrane lipoprotein-sorting protein
MLNFIIWFPKYLFAFLVLFSTPILAQTENTAKAIVEKAEDKMRGNSSYAEMTIKIVRPTWERELKMKTWSKGKKNALIVITSPQKDKGTVFLKRDKEVWNYLPSIERNIKLPPSMMSQSWMGTDFTNDDLVKEASAADDYSHLLIGDTVLHGRSCYKILMKPTPEASVVWGKVLVWIDKKDYLQLRSEFYDEENVFVNIMTGSDIKELGGRLLPTKLEMIPLDKKGNKTIMTYEQLKFDIPLKDEFFSTQNMKQIN